MERNDRLDECRGGCRRQRPGGFGRHLDSSVGILVIVVDNFFLFFLSISGDVVSRTGSMRVWVLGFGCEGTSKVPTERLGGSFGGNYWR